MKRVLKARDLLLALYKYTERKEHLLIVIVVVVVVTVYLVKKEKSCVFVKRPYFSTILALVQI